MPDFMSAILKITLFRYSKNYYRVSLKKSVILEFRFLGTSSDSKLKEMCNAMINITATSQLAIIVL